MEDNIKKIGIIGGTFDPVHFGHLFLAQTALAEAGLDKVLFMPTKDPYYRTDKKVSPEKHRLRMTELAIEDNPAFELSDFEIKSEPPVYTCDTLKRFKEQNPEAEVYFIVGGDSLFSIEKWQRPEDIFANAVILSAKREDENKGASGSLGVSPESENRFSSLEEEFEAKVAELKERFGARIVNVHVPNIEISSSDIIRRMKAGKNVKYYLPDKVIEYINENGLYTAD